MAAMLGNLLKSPDDSARRHSQFTMLNIRVALLYISCICSVTQDTLFLKSCYILIRRIQLLLVPHVLHRSFNHYAEYHKTIASNSRNGTTPTLRQTVTRTMIRHDTRRRKQQRSLDFSAAPRECTQMPSSSNWRAQLGKWMRSTQSLQTSPPLSPSPKPQS